MLSVRLRMRSAFLVVVVEILAAERALAEVLAEVRGVGAAAAVAADEDHAAVAVAVIHDIGQGLDLRRVDAQQFLSDPVQKRPNVQCCAQHARASRKKNGGSGSIRTMSWGPDVPARVQPGPHRRYNTNHGIALEERHPMTNDTATP